MNTQIQELNRLPMPTWGWLGINGVGLPALASAGPYTGDPLGERPKDVVFSEDTALLQGNAMSTLLEGTAYLVEEKANYTQPT